MIKLTSIIYLQGVLVHSVRTHTGHKDAESAARCLDGFECAEVGDAVEMWPMNLYADVSEAAGPPLRFSWNGESWEPYEDDLGQATGGGSAAPRVPGEEVPT